MKVLKWLFSLILALIVVFPFYWVIVSSFKPADQILSPDLFPKAFTLEHYRQLLEMTSYLQNLWNSILVSLGTLVCTVLIVIPAGFAIYRMKFPGRLFVYRLIMRTIF